jgi:hypothetical protein
MRQTVVMLAAVAVALVPGLALGDGEYPQQAYIGPAPNDPSWLALATLDGIWAVQVDDSCPNLLQGLGGNVVLLDAVEADDAAISSIDGSEPCRVVSKVQQTTRPCAIGPDGQYDAAYAG